MAFYKELSSLVYKPRHISDKNMASFSYNTDDFPPLPSNRTDHQLTSVYIPLKPRAQNSNVASFSNTGNPLLFEKNVFVCTSKAYFFPFKSDGIFRSDTRSPVLSRKSFVCATSGPSRACFSPVPPIAVRNCKTPVIVLHIVILSVRVVVRLIELVNLNTLLLVHLIVLQISVSLLNSLPVIDILLIPVHLHLVLLVIAIFTVNVSCVKV